MNYKRQSFPNHTPSGPKFSAPAGPVNPRLNGIGHIGTMDHVALHADAPQMISSRSARIALIAFGWLCVAVGLVGVVVPGLPTTIFMIIAAWAFSRSSARFQRWLLEHPRFGPAVIAWRENGAIPPRAKLLALVTMASSLAFISFFVAHDWVLPAVVGAIMTAVAVYILTRPNA